MKRTLSYIIIGLSVVLLLSFVLGFQFPKGSKPEDSTKPEVETQNPEDGAKPEGETQNPVNNEIFADATYVAFGDSITYGADNTRNYSAMDFPYPALVAESLDLASVSNRGISGSTLCRNDFNLVCMTDMILSYTDQANIISVMLGVNDYNRSLPLGDIDDKTNETVYGSLNLIAEHLTTTQEDAFVFFMTPYKCKVGTKSYKDPNAAGYVLEDVVNAVKEVASKYNIPVLDMFNEGQYELEMYNYGSDGIHPSQEFVREYTAPQIAEFIRQNYRGK